MAIKDVGAYIEKRGLVETTDAEIEKPIYRKPGLDGIASFGDMEEVFSNLVRAKRDEHNLNRAQLAMMLGLSEQVFARYERAISKMHVTRLVHLSEILGFSPLEMIHAAAPHLFGATQQEADDKMALISRMLKMPAPTSSALLNLVEELSPDEPTDPAEKKKR